MNASNRRELFERARALDRADRDAFLAAHCSDAALRDELARMLLAAESHDDPIADRVQRAAADTVHQLGMPAMIGSYRIVSLLGEGGMGSVWLGERDDGAFKRQVAIKVIRGMPSTAAVERFRRERQVLAGLEHPQIARLHDGGTTATGEPFLVMEYVEGRALGDWVVQTAPDLAQRMQLFASLCRAVHFAHQRLVVHCDLKPANVMVRADGSPVLLDFGIARLLEPGDGAARTATFAATPAYASPEQLLNQPVTMATDVFGLGMVLYELLTGRVPARTTDAISLSRELPAPSRLPADPAHATTSTDPALLRGDLDAIVRRAIRVEPGMRYGSAADLADDAQAWLDGRPVAAVGGHWRYLSGKFIRRHRLAVALGSTAVVALVALSVLLGVQNRAARIAQAAAEREAAAARATSGFLQDLYTELDPARHPGRRIDALELLDLGRQRLDRLESAAPATRAALERSLANIYLQIGKPEPALVLARSAAARLQASTATVRDRVESDALLARALNAALDFPAARETGDRALAGAIALGDTALEAPIRTARAWSALALEDTAAARADYDRAEAIFETQGESAREPLARLAYNRAQLAESQGDETAALVLYQRAMQINEQVSGREHPTTLISQFGAGKSLINLGRSGQARELLADLLERSVRVHGEQSMATERALAELGNAEREVGALDAAREHFRRAMAVSLAINAGRQTQQFAHHLGNLATVEEYAGDLDAALALAQQSTASRIALGGADSRNAARGHHLIARIQLARDARDAAAASNAEALRIRSAALPAAHEELLLSVALRAEIGARALAPGDAAYDLAMLQAGLERDPPLFVRGQQQLLRGIAALAAAQGNQNLRIDALARAVGSVAAAQGNAHPVLAAARLRLAAALADGGDTEAARRELAQAQPAVARSHPQSPLRKQLQALLQRVD